MTGYITTVAAVAIMAAFADILIPKGWQKYISILTGAILLIALISPILRLRGITPVSFSFPEQEIREYDTNDIITQQFTKRIEGDIEERIKREFNTATTATVKLTILDEKISGVYEILLSGKENISISSRLYEIYGCKNIIWEGN